jgi:hypothetical protein
MAFSKPRGQPRFIIVPNPQYKAARAAVLRKKVPKSAPSVYRQALDAEAGLRARSGRVYAANYELDKQISDYNKSLRGYR